MGDQAFPLTVGSWSFAFVPDGWEVIEGYGLRRTGKETFPSNVVVDEEQIREDWTLSQYLEAQTVLLRAHLLEPEIQGPQATALQEADEALELVVRHKDQNGQVVVQRQVYARCGLLVGIATFTTLVKELPHLEPVFARIKAALIFQVDPGRGGKSS